MSGSTRPTQARVEVKKSPGPSPPGCPVGVLFGLPSPWISNRWHGRLSFVHTSSSNKGIHAQGIHIATPNVEGCASCRRTRGIRPCCLWQRAQVDEQHMDDGHREPDEIL
jgi:hypothetical protein